MQQQPQENLLNETAAPTSGLSIMDYAKESSTNAKPNLTKKVSNLRLQIPKRPLRTERTSFQIKKSINFLTPKEKSTPTLNKFEFFHTRSATLNKANSMSIDVVDSSGLNTPTDMPKSSSSGSENKFSFLRVAQTPKDLSTPTKKPNTKQSSEMFSGFLPKIATMEVVNNSNLSISSAGSVISLGSLHSKNPDDSRVSALLRKSQVGPTLSRFKIDTINETNEENARGNKNIPSVVQSRLDSVRDWDQAYTPIYRRLGIELVQKFNPTVPEDRSQPLHSKELVHSGINFLKESLVSASKETQTPRKRNFKINSPLIRSLKGRSDEFHDERILNSDISKFEKSLESLPHYQKFCKADLEAFKRFHERTEVKRY